MLPAPPEKIKTQYIRHNACENLFAIPYVRSRLVFAELVARAIATGDFELVVVDLPAFLQDDPYSSYPVSLFPSVSSLVIRNGTSELTRLPFSPSDAACAAIAATGFAKQPGKPIALHFVDDSAAVHYHQHLAQPLPDLRDDYHVFSAGLEQYFRRPMEELAACWGSLSAINRFYLEHRAAQVTERLITLLDQRKQTLFVCEYRLWRMVSSRLHARSHPRPNPIAVPWHTLSAALAIEDPLRFWALGLLDDYPALVHEFYTKLTEHRTEAFDKLESLDALLLRRDSSKDPGSTRTLLAFSHYLRNRLWARRRWIPQPVSQLHDSALACLGPRSANSLAKRFLRYPAPYISGAARYLSIGENHLAHSDQHFDIPDASQRGEFMGLDTDPHACETFGQRFQLALKASPRLTMIEKDALLPVEDGTKWAVATDYHLHDIACTNARRLASQRTRCKHPVARPMRRGLEGGVDMRATLFARARNDTSVYVKPHLRTRKNTNRFDEATPTVFLFDDDVSSDPSQVTHDANVTQRKIELDNTHLFSAEDPRPDRVYSVFVTYRSDRRMCHGHIEQLELSSLALLYTRYMGMDRHAAIVRRPARFQCRCNPEYDRDLRIVSYAERGLAWTVKYADDSVIVVARNGWAPTPTLSAFADAHRVSLFHVPLSRFSPDFIDRLRIKHAISTPLKKHPKRDEIVARFLP